jgi:hypothetical protein
MEFFLSLRADAVRRRSHPFTHLGDCLRHGKFVSSDFSVGRDDWTPSGARPVTNLNRMPRATLAWCGPREPTWGLGLQPAVIVPWTSSAKTCTGLREGCRCHWGSMLGIDIASAKAQRARAKPIAICDTTQLPTRFRSAVAGACISLSLTVAWVRRLARPATTAQAIGVNQTFPKGIAAWSDPRKWGQGAFARAVIFSTTQVQRPEAEMAVTHVSFSVNAKKPNKKQRGHAPSATTPVSNQATPLPSWTPCEPSSLHC